MRIPKWLGLPFYSFLLVFSAHAALTDDTKISDDSIGSIFQRELLKQGNLELAVSNMISNYPEHSRAIMRNAIVTSPGSIEGIISAGLSAGASSEDVAAQCTDSLPVEQIQTMVSTAVGENADPETMMETCLLAVDAEQAFNVLTAILQNADPQQFEELIAQAVELLEFNGLDGITIVVNSLVEGEFLTAQTGCVVDCLRPLAESLVQRNRTVTLPAPPAQDDSVLVEVLESQGREPVASSS